MEQAAAITPGRPAAGSIWRWARRGITARNGDVIKLQHIRSGRRLFTTHQWLLAFCDSLAAADQVRSAAPAGSSSYSMVPVRKELHR